jgi:hypothetical protein
MNTMMALWNRGWKGRLSVVILTFISLCISISLLVITASSAWGALFAQKHLAGVPTSTGYSSFLTQTGGAIQLTATATTTQISVPNPCVVTGTAGAQATTRPSPRASATRSRQPGGGPHKTATPTRIHPQHTPTPIITKTAPVHQPTPTLPVVTPTPAVTPSPIPPTPTLLPTATPTLPPTPTPTPVVTPTSTATPALTPTATATLVVTPTVTTTPAVTASPSAQPGWTPTVGGSPTATPTLIGTAGNKHASGRAPISGGSSPQANAGGASTDPFTAGKCLGDSVLLGGVPALLLLLQIEFWVVVSSSLAGTIIFCGKLAKASRGSRL